MKFSHPNTSVLLKYLCDCRDKIGRKNSMEETATLVERVKSLLDYETCL